MSPEKIGLLNGLDASARPDDSALPLVTSKVQEVAVAAGLSVEAVVDASLGVSAARATLATHNAKEAKAALATASAELEAAERTVEEKRAAAGRAHAALLTADQCAAVTAHASAAAEVAAAALAPEVRERLRSLLGKWPGSSFV